MAFLLRGIGNKAWWDKSRDDFSWLGEDDLIADVLKSLGAVGGALSTYVVDEERTKIDRVVAALASRRGKIENFDYILAPVDVVLKNFRSDNTTGKTPDSEVNAWHLDIVHLTPAKLTQLAYIFRNHKEALCRMPRPSVKSALQTSKNHGFLDMEKVSPNVKQELT